jgi:hypothetical protein
MYSFDCSQFSTAAKPRKEPYSLGCLIGPRPSIVKKKQKSIISTPLRSLAIGRSKECVHLLLFQVGNQCLTGFLEWNRTDLSAPLYVLRAL